MNLVNQISSLLFFRDWCWRNLIVVKRHNRLAKPVIQLGEAGLRRSNVTGLQWSQVDIVRRVAWIHPDQAKAKKAITVPLSDTAIAVLLRQRAKKRAPEFVDSVFVYQGRPVYQTVTAAWSKALNRAGIRDFRWHDLRHTWASWHVQRGTPLQVLRSWVGGKRSKWCSAMHTCRPLTWRSGYSHICLLPRSSNCRAKQRQRRRKHC